MPFERFKRLKMKKKVRRSGKRRKNTMKKLKK